MMSVSATTPIQANHAIAANSQLFISPDDCTDTTGELLSSTSLIYSRGGGCRARLRRKKASAELPLSAAKDEVGGKGDDVRDGQTDNKFSHRLSHRVIASERGSNFIEGKDQPMFGLVCRPSS